MPDTIAAIAPVAALVFLGWCLRKADFAPDALWSGLDRLTRFLLLPCLLASGLAGANLDDLPVGAAVLAAAAGVLAAVLSIHALRRAVAAKSGAGAALVPCSVHGNVYLVLAMVLALFDETGLPAFAVALIAFVPLAGLAGALAGARAGGKGAAAPKALGPAVREILLNPLLIGIALGLAINLADTGIPGPVDGILQTLGRAALPLGLLVVGAGLVFGAAAGRTMLASMAVKLVLLPACVLAALSGLAIEGTVAAALLIHAAAPCAIPAAGRLSGGDARAAAAMVAAQTVVALVTLPLWLWLAADIL